MKSIIVFATAYPYAAAILAVIWIGSAFLLRIDQNLSLDVVLMINFVMTVVIATIGFRK